MPRKFRSVELDGGPIVGKAGDNNKEINVPTGQLWQIFHAMLVDNDNAVDTDVTIQWPQNYRARCYLTLDQTTAGKTIYHGEVWAPPSSIIRFNWYSVTADDDLLWAIQYNIWEIVEEEREPETKGDVQQPKTKPKDPSM